MLLNYLNPTIDVGLNIQQAFTILFGRAIFFNIF